MICFYEFLASKMCQVSLVVQYMFCWKVKHSSWRFIFWKRLLHQILGFTVSIATLNCMQNTQMQYLVISFIGNRYLKYLRN